MNSRLAAERSSVQDPLIRYATEIGWSPLHRDAAIAERGGEAGLLLRRTLEKKLIELNPGVVDADNARDILSRIENARADIEGNHEILRWLRGEQTVKVPSERRTRNATVIDFEHLENNVFQVTSEWEYRNGRAAGRADVVFLINGIPIAIVETKNAKKRDAIDRAIKDIRVYHAQTPEMMVAPQTFEATDLHDLFYGVTWNLDRKSIFQWKDDETSDFERRVKRFFGRERILRVLRDWIIFYRREDTLQKIILRQHQSRGVDRVVSRALDPEKRRGLVWHTQGSGKTFTMISTAERIIEHPAFRNEKPTVLMVVDRTELEQQLFQNLSAYGLPVEVAKNRRKLRNLLQSDFRGVILTMVHKFRDFDADLMTRSNVFVLIDEAHRTVGGASRAREGPRLADYLMGALPNATFIGFTGTPIDRTAHGEGTFKVFGIDDPMTGYLDKYSIAESISDGTTLQLHYTLAPNEMQVDDEMLEKEFFALTETEGVSEIEELNTILDRAVNLKAFLKADARIEKVAAFVADHFRSNVEPLGYKAFLVAVDRQACALYKEALDQVLPPEYSCVVYSSAAKEADALIRKYEIEPDEEREIRKAFVRREGKPVRVGTRTYPPGFPKILIVTEKLLTGFDAPILYCMYLDKPMRDHTLLQAIARVNRPYTEGADHEKEKPAGLVVDFVGIFDNLEKALAFDSEDVASVIENIDTLKDRFAKLMGDAGDYLQICRPPFDDKAVERALDAFSDRERRQEFFEWFKDLETLYEIISPDPFLRPFLDDYATLAALHSLIRSRTGSSYPFLGDLMAKTEQLVRQHAVVEGLDGLLAPVTLDEEALTALKTDEGSAAAKVINLGRSIVENVEQNPDQPYLLPIGRRAEAILDRFDDRQTSTADAMAQLEDLVREYLRIREEKELLALDDTTFNFFQVLRQAGLEPVSAEELSGVVNALFGKYPARRENAAQRRDLKAELYRELRNTFETSDMVEIADRLLES